MQGALDAASGIVSTLGNDLATPGPTGPASLDARGARSAAPRPTRWPRHATAPTALLPDSVGNLLAPVTGSLPTLLQPVQNTVPQLLAPVQNVLPTLPGIGKIQPPLGAVTNPLPELPTPPAPSAPAAGPSDNPAGPLAPGGSPAPPADPFGPGSPLSWPGSAAAESGDPVFAGAGGFPGAGSFLGTPPSALASTATNFVSASAVPPAEPGNGPQDSPSIPLPSAPGPAFSPGAAGGWFFIPLAALMALVGLSAPAIMRRLREAAALPAPTPFVCALERPG